MDRPVFITGKLSAARLAVAIYDAVYAAGMAFPFPQRDVHIIQDAQPEGSRRQEAIRHKDTNGLRSGQAEEKC